MLRAGWATQFLIDCAVGSNARANFFGERPAFTNSTRLTTELRRIGSLVLAITDFLKANVPRSTKPGNFRITPKSPNSNLLILSQYTL